MTKEQKLADAIANAVEDHWFNPATVGRILANQPYYTIDRLMEIVAWVIEKQAGRHDDELQKGRDISEGLFLAKELDKVIDKYKTKYQFNNIKLP
jgi:hypothetical protein